MNILLLGSGGRESALAWKLAQSKHVKHLWIAPGNAGTASFGTNIPISETDFEAIKKIALEKKISMLVVGPEAPLAQGIYDYFKNNERLKHIQVIGPSEKGARLESSKDFAKEFMRRHKIPTARHRTFTRANIAEAYTFLSSLSPPYVLKADGLAAGKGVIICQNYDEATRELSEMLEKQKFGSASEHVIIEEFLHGIELSVFVLTDGRDYLILPNAKDYKRIGDGDTGPNTGGMGAVSPVPFADGDFMSKVEERIIQPTIAGINQENIDYCGIIFIGLMNCNGDPFVIEYNVRLGDPETEAIIPRIENDLVELFLSTVEGRLKTVELRISPNYAVTVMLVSGGYPGTYEKGKIIQGIENIDECVIFQAGTTTNEQGETITNGGRVLAITGMGATLELARQKAYNGAGKIHFYGINYRRDIGEDLLRWSSLNNHK